MSFKTPTLTVSGKWLYLSIDSTERSEGNYKPSYFDGLDVEIDLTSALDIHKL